jgi:hypothetical protein
MRNSYEIVVGYFEGKRPLGRHRRNREHNIRTDLIEIECEGVDWIRLVQVLDQWRVLGNVVMDLRVPYRGGGGDFFTA